MKKKIAIVVFLILATALNAIVTRELQTSLIIPGIIGFAIGSIASHYWK